uniref:F-box and leucine rich repeat protein 13 n=1 Tax=Poecilia reticulata TaxID=8081 RepID=A0A3P9PQG1_POERE
MIQRITEGCQCLLYLNLSYTLITNQSLRAIISLQYLGLAHCCRFTDEGFLTLATEEGGRNLMHLDLTGCIQMTPKGFEYISAGCPSLKEVVMNDMPSLSDTCLLVRLYFCNISEVTQSKPDHWYRNLFVCALGNYQVTEASWEVLCGFSTALSKLHVVDCNGMTDEGMKYVSSLRHLNYLDISLCSRWVKGVLASFAESTVLRRSVFHHKLFHLNLSYCEKVTDQALDYLNGSSIQSLDLTGCNIRDQVLNHGLDSLKKIQLKKIVVAKCIFITDMGIEVHIFQTPGLFPSGYLFCRIISPFLLEADVRKERYQHGLIPLFMPSYSPSGQKLCDNMRDLEHIDISQCPALTDAAIGAISLYCRSLLRMKMAACPQVQFASAYRVKSTLFQINALLDLLSLEKSGIGTLLKSTFDSWCQQPSSISYKW